MGRGRVLELLTYTTKAIAGSVNIANEVRYPTAGTPQVFASLRTNVASYSQPGLETSSYRLLRGTRPLTLSRTRTSLYAALCLPVSYFHQPKSAKNSVSACSP